MHIDDFMYTGNEKFNKTVIKLLMSWFIALKSFSGSDKATAIPIYLLLIL